MSNLTEVFPPQTDDFLLQADRRRFRTEKSGLHDGSRIGLIHFFFWKEPVSSMAQQNMGST